MASHTEFRTQDLFEADLSPATVVTMYLLPEVNLQLRPRILQLAPGTRLVSHDWDMGDWKPDRTVTVDAPEKNIGLEKKSRVHLWVVPADFSGRAAPPRARCAARVRGCASPARFSPAAPPCWSAAPGNARPGLPTTRGHRLPARGATAPVPPVPHRLP